MRPWSARLALLLSVLPASGCCSLARLFCGPDRTPWISVDYSTPARAARTLLEALRRDEPEVVYLSLSQAYARRLGVDAMSARLAWPRIREANPGLHVAGYAEVPTPTRLGPDRARVEIDVAGTRVVLDLVREAQWRVRYERPGTSPGEPGAALPSFLGRLELTADPAEQRSRLQLAPFDVEHEGFDALTSEQIEFVGLERQWKIDDLRTEG